MIFLCHHCRCFGKENFLLTFIYILGMSYPFRDNSRVLGLCANGAQSKFVWAILEGCAPYMFCICKMCQISQISSVCIIFSHGLLREAWIVLPLCRYLFIYLFIYLFSSLTFFENATPPRVVDRF